MQTQSGYEVDFLAEGTLGERELVQVCADLSDPQTRHREMRALEEAMAETGLDRATLVTLREEGSEALGKGVVHIVPAWRWLLDPARR